MTPDEITTLAAKTAIGEFEKMFEKIKPPEIQKVKVVTDPYDFSKPLNKHSSSGANTKKPNEPQIRVQNPLDKEVRLQGLTLILDTDSTKRAKLIVSVDLNETPYADDFNSGFFENLSSFSIPLSNEGHKISPKQYIDIYLWSTDGTDIKLSVSAFIQSRPQG